MRHNVRGMESLLECFGGKLQCMEAFVMSFKTGTSLVFLAASLTALAALPANAATSSNPARQNVSQSERYDRLLETNRSFRQARMRKECGQSPIRNCVRAASTALRNTSPRRPTRPLREGSPRRNQLGIRPPMSARRRHRGIIKAAPDSSRRRCSCAHSRRSY